MLCHKCGGASELRVFSSFQFDYCPTCRVEVVVVAPAATTHSGGITLNGNTFPQHIWAPPNFGGGLITNTPTTITHVKRDVLTLAQGDKVRALHNSISGAFQKGAVYTVRAVIGSTVHIAMDSYGNTTNGWHHSNFEAFQ